MISIRSSILTRINTSTITYSTLTGSTLSFTSLLIASTINPTNTTAATVTTYSTLTGSSIVTTNLSLASLQQSTFTTIQPSAAFTSTLTIGPTFNITNGTNTGTLSSLSYYQADITETTRVAIIQQHDNSVAVTAQPPLDYLQFGQNWTAVNQLPQASWTAAALSASGQYQTVGGNGTGLYYSSNYGQTWIYVAMSGYIIDVKISASGQYQFVCISGGGIFYSFNYGQTWTTSNAPNLNWKGICISASGQYGSAGAVSLLNANTFSYYTSNYGQTWTASSYNGFNFAMACSASGQYQINGQGQNGGIPGIFYSSNYGRNFTISNNTTAQACWFGAMSATGQYSIITTNPISNVSIYISNNYGRTFTTITLGFQAFGATMSASGQYQMVTAYSAGNGYGTGIYYSTNYGQTWTLSASTASLGGMYQVATSANGQYSLACLVASGSVYQSTIPFFTTGSSTNLVATNIQSNAIIFGDGSAAVSAMPPLDYSTFALNWTQSGSLSQNWFALSMSASGQYQINAIYNGAIYYSSNYGQTWTAVTSSPALLWGRSAMSASGQYAIICPGNNNITTPGLVYISSTYGQTWSATTISVNGCVAISASGQYMAICNTFWSDANNSVNGIYVSSNYGQSWRQTNTTSMYAICMSSTGQYIYASSYAVNYAGYSTNYGQTWTAISGITPSTIGIQHIACSASGQYVTFTGNGTGIYYSSNYGQTFTRSASFTSAQCMCVAMTASGQYQVASQWNSSTIYYSSTYGVTWSSTTGSAGQSLITISASGQYITISPGMGAFGGGGFITTSITRTPPIFTSGTLVATGQSGVSATSGYTTLPGGIIMQYGRGTTAAPVVNSGVDTTVTFPKAFSSACYAVMGSVSDLGTNVSYIENLVTTNSYTTTSFGISLKSVYSSFTFTPCGASGISGPTSLTYDASSFAWGTLSSFITLGTGSNGIPAGIQRFTVPFTGTYVLTAAGAGGGSGAFAGGRGVIVSTTVSLTANQTIFILVGQRGTSTGSTAGYQGSGGGGTFICRYNGGSVSSAGSYTILLIAGGGGGAGAGFGGGGSGAAGVGQGGDAVTTTTGGVNTTTGGVSVTRFFAAAATGGAGGIMFTSGGAYAGSGGGGFSGNGQFGGIGSNQSAAAISFLGGGTGGQNSQGGNGGFGGGGGSDPVNANWGVGGGGGYSGGAGATVSSGWVWSNYGAGGGGSYDINGASNNATLTTSLGSSGYNPAATDGYAIVRLANRSTAPLTYYYVAYGR
jgi:hypothetical protein